MAPEHKRIWLSRGRAKDGIWACNVKPERLPDPLAPDEEVYFRHGGADIIFWGCHASVLAATGFDVQPGQCIPIDLVPGEPLRAEGGDDAP